jgi:hypothetical protein
MAISNLRVLSSVSNRGNAANEIELFGLTCLQNHLMNVPRVARRWRRIFAPRAACLASRKPASVQLNPKSDKGEQRHGNPSSLLSSIYEDARRSA